VEALGEDFQLQAVGSGPFVLESWTPGGSAVFVKNPSYWRAGADGQPLPYLDEIVIEGVADDAVRLLNLRSGQFDINERVEPKDKPALAADANLQAIEYTTATSYLVALNVTAAPFDNAALRQAVAAAIDRQAIIDNIGFGTGYTVALPFPKEAWFSIDSPMPVFDAEAARARLGEAGFPDGIDVKLSIINRPIDNQIAQIVKAQLDAVGIRTEIEVLERTTWVDLWTARGGQMGILQRGAGTGDPDDQSAFFDPANIANFAGYDSPEIWALVQQANETTDQAERKAIWQQIAGIVQQDCVYNFIGAVPTVGAARASVIGIELIGGGVVDPAVVSITE
jgi:peptide/nickel transport system substrate-binding protein